VVVENAFNLPRREEKSPDSQRVVEPRAKVGIVCLVANGEIARVKPLF
jgi:hypothetical protein